MKPCSAGTMEEGGRLSRKWWNRPEGMRPRGSVKVNRVSHPGPRREPSRTNNPTASSSTFSPGPHPHLRINTARLPPAAAFRKEEHARNKKRSREGREERGRRRPWDPRTASLAGSLRHLAPWIFQALVVARLSDPRSAAFSQPAAL